MTTPNLPTEDELRDEVTKEVTGSGSMTYDSLGEHASYSLRYADRLATVDNIMQLIHHYATKRELEAELKGRIIEACRQHDVKYAADGCQFCDGDAYSAEHDVDISHIEDMESKLKAQKEQENK